MAFDPSGRDERPGISSAPPSGSVGGPPHEDRRERNSSQIWWRNNRARKHYILLGIGEYCLNKIHAARLWMTDHPMHTSACSISLIVLCLMFNAYFLAKPAVEAAAFEEVPQHWYFDLNTNELFVAPAGQVAPIDAPSGPFKSKSGVTNLPAGVRAFVFSCTACSDASRQFIGYLEIYHPNVKKRIDALHAGNSISIGATYEQVANSTGPPLVADPMVLNWVPMSGEEGNQLISSLRSTCADGSPPRQCNPPAMVVATQQQAFEEQAD